MDPSSSCYRLVPHPIQMIATNLRKYQSRLCSVLKISAHAEPPVPGDVSSPVSGLTMATMMLSEPVQKGKCLLLEMKAFCDAYLVTCPIGLNNNIRGCSCVICAMSLSSFGRSPGLTLFLFIILRNIAWVDACECGCLQRPRE